jgi:hypothetical protein
MEQIPLSLEQQLDDFGEGEGEGDDPPGGKGNPGHKGEKVRAMACGQYEDSTEQCNIAFEYGNENNNTCVGEDDKLICTPAICEEAAIEAGLSIIHHNNQTMRDEFEIPADFFDVYPKGCFRHECPSDDDPSRMCLFFNGAGDNPSNPVGYPVCSKARYLFGKNNTKSTDADQCPEGYLRIDHRDECDSARQCMGLSRSTYFTIQNGHPDGDDFPLPYLDYHKSIDRMDYPDGCFFTETTTIVGGLVFFNPYDANDVPTMSRIHDEAGGGTPICRHPNELELKDIHTSGAASAANGHR